MLGDDVPRGARPPGLANVIVETPKGSRVKYASSEDHGALQVSKVLPPTFAYPANTGYFARCWGEDGDPLDAMVLTEAVLAPGTVCAARPVAVLRMTDRGDRDDKVVCVLDGDKDWEAVTGLSGIPRHVRQQWETFHSAYRIEEGTQRQVRLQGWAGKAAALRLVRKGYRCYDERTDAA